MDKKEQFINKIKRNTDKGIATKLVVCKIPCFVQSMSGNLFIITGPKESAAQKACEAVYMTVENDGKVFHATSTYDTFYHLFLGTHTTIKNN